MTTIERAARDMTAACACIRVEYRPRSHDSGTFSDRWCCVSCGDEFKRSTVSDRERELTARVAVLSEALDAITKAAASYELCELCGETPGHVPRCPVLAGYRALALVPAATTGEGT